MDCLDEISASAETKVAEVRGKNISYYTIKPEDFGFERVNKDDLMVEHLKKMRKLQQQFLSLIHIFSKHRHIRKIF